MEVTTAEMEEERLTFLTAWGRSTKELWRGCRSAGADISDLKGGTLLDWDPWEKGSGRLMLVYWRGMTKLQGFATRAKKKTTTATWI